MSGTVTGVGAAPPATATDATGTPNQDAWNKATAPNGGTSASGGTSAAMKAEQAKMVEQIGQVMMMPLIQQAMNAGQDDG